MLPNNSQTALCRTPIAATSTEDYVYAVDFTRVLRPGEALDPNHVPTLTYCAGSLTDLVVTGLAVNASPVLDDNQNTIAAGNAVTLDISGGTPKKLYEFIITAQLTSGKKRAGICQLNLER